MAQPLGKHFPRTIWEYRKEHPIRASVYFSGMLAAPRLTILWLCFMEQSTVQQVHEAAATRLRAYLERWSGGGSLKVSTRPFYPEDVKQ
jgi:hypothetical protein